MGEYPNLDSTVLNDQISAVQVADGYVVELFENDNFNGNSILITPQSELSIVSMFNDVASSAKVYTADTAPETPETTTPETTDNNTPETPDNTTPESPDNTTPESPDNNTPESPDNNTPESPDNNTPESPDNTTPESPDNTASETPDTTTPDTPDNTTSETTAAEPELTVGGGSIFVGLLLLSLLRVRRLTMSYSAFS